MLNTKNVILWENYPHPHTLVFFFSYFVSRPLCVHFHANACSGSNNSLQCSMPWGLWRRKLITDYWQHDWVEFYTNNPTQYALIISSIDFSSWYRNIVLSNFYMSIISLAFRHGIFPYHLFMLGMIDSPACPCGIELRVWCS